MFLFIKKKFVEELGWLKENEMLDITAIAQSSPGPIPVNASIILGYKLHGILGSFVAVIGTIIPPFVIISFISIFYHQFRNNKIIAISLQVMRAGVAAVILDVVVSLIENVIKTKNRFHMILIFLAFIAAYFLNISAMFIIFACLIVGLITIFSHHRKGKKDESSTNSIH